MAQTTYALKAAAASAGDFGDTGPNRVASMLNEEAGDMPVALGLVQGTHDDGAKLPAASTDLFVGVVANSYARDPSGLTTGSYLTGSQMPLVTKGPIWVTVEEAVTPASKVFLRYAAGAGGTQKGAFRASADTATAVQIKGQRFLGSAGVGGLVQLMVDVEASRQA